MQRIDEAAKYGHGKPPGGAAWSSAGPALPFLHFSCQAAFHGLLLVFSDCGHPRASLFHFWSPFTPTQEGEVIFLQRTPVIVRMNGISSEV